MASKHDHRPMATVLRNSPRPVWILLGGVLVNRTGSYFAIFATLFLTSQGFAVSDLPPILAALAVSTVLGSLGGGWLADRLTRRMALVATTTASAASLTFLAVAQAQPAVVAAVCLAGFFTQAYIPAAYALLVDHAPPEDRVPAFALFRLALNVGSALGPLIAGILASWSYAALFLVDAGTSAAFAMLLFFALPRGTSGRHATPPDDQQPQAFSAQPRAPRAGRSKTAVPLLLVAMFGVTMVYAQQASTLPLHLADQGHAPSVFGFLLAFNAAIIIVAELPLSSLTRRYAWPAPLALGAVLIGGGMAASLIVGASVAVGAAVLIWTIGEMLLAPIANSAIAELAPGHGVARYQSYLWTAQTLGFSLGPVAGTFIYAHVPAALPLGCALMGLSCALLIFAVRRLLVERQDPYVVAV